MTILKLKSSNVPNKVPELVDLELAELAINTNSGKLFLKKDNGVASIVELGGLRWIDIVVWPSVVLGTTTLGGNIGTVYAHTSGSTTYYRFIPSTYSAALDKFYLSYSNNVLSSLVASRS